MCHAPHAWNWALAAVCHGIVPDTPTMEETTRFVLDTLVEAKEAAQAVIEELRHGEPAQRGKETPLWSKDR